MAGRHAPILELDATHWRDCIDFYRALLEAVGAPDWHGMSVDAFIDSIIYGDINAIDPPFTVRIKGVASAPIEVREGIDLLMQHIRPANAQVEWEVLP